MPDANPITAAAEERADRSWLEGAGMAKDATDLATKIASGDWTEGLLPLASLVYETKDFLSDPLAKLTSIGLGWAIEFFEPLRMWLDGLTGNQEHLNQFVESWSGIAAEMTAAADELHDHYTRDTAAWEGMAAAQYRLYCANQVELYRAASASARSVADCARISGTILTVVREIVRGLFTDAVGKAISIACRYPPPTTVAAVPEIANTVVSTGNKIVEWFTKLKNAFANAHELLASSRKLFHHVRGNFQFAAEAKTALYRTAREHHAFMSGVDALRYGRDVAVKAIPGKIPEKVIIEGGKGATAATTTDDPSPTEQSALYEGPGPHRVTGTLE